MPTCVSDGEPDVQKAWSEREGKTDRHEPLRWHLDIVCRYGIGLGRDVVDKVADLNHQGQRCVLLLEDSGDFHAICILNDLDDIEVRKVVLILLVTPIDGEVFVANLHESDRLDV